MALFGELRKSFEVAAASANNNPSLSNKVTWKTVQDRYKRLQEQFDKADNDNQRLSGVGGGKMEEHSELLMTMREARDDIEAKENAEKTAQQKKEEEKKKKKKNRESVLLKPQQNASNGAVMKMKATVKRTRTVAGAVVATEMVAKRRRNQGTHGSLGTIWRARWSVSENI